MGLLLIKDCASFVPLKDGTVRGEEKYCDLSFQCKQTGMKSEHVEITDVNGVVSYDFLCTGCKIESLEENREFIKAT
jgi:hypothetical protein